MQCSHYSCSCPDVINQRGKGKCLPHVRRTFEGGTSGKMRLPTERTKWRENGVRWLALRVFWSVRSLWDQAPPSAAEARSGVADWLEGGWMSKRLPNPSLTPPTDAAWLPPPPISALIHCPALRRPSVTRVCSLASAPLPSLPLEQGLRHFLHPNTPRLQTPFPA